MAQLEAELQEASMDVMNQQKLEASYEVLLYQIPLPQASYEVLRYQIPLPQTPWLYKNSAPEHICQVSMKFVVFAPQ